MKIRSSAKALIVRDEKLLAMRKESGDKPYYVLFGGGQEFGEPLRDAVKRECLEEAGIEVEPGELLFVRDYIGARHEFADVDGHRHHLEFFFVCRPLTEPDLSKATEQDEGQLGFEWLPIETLDQVMLYPLTMRKFVQQYFLEGIVPAVYMGCVN